jgi:hypothetical protein
MFYAIAQTLQRTFAARALRMGLVAGLSGIVISACGGGAQTTDNPITSVTPPSSYNGPPPQTTDIR